MQVCSPSLKLQTRCWHRCPPLSAAAMTVGLARLSHCGSHRGRYECR
jgi:hypothetical protein